MIWNEQLYSLRKGVCLKTRLQNLIKNLFHYGIVGGIAALAEWISFYISNEPLHINHMWSTCIAFVAGTATNFFLASRFVFKTSKYTRAGEVALVYLVSLVGLLCNLGLMRLFVDTWQWWPMLSKILATGIVFLWNFLSRRYLIYREKGGEKRYAARTAPIRPAHGAVYHVAPADEAPKAKQTEEA